MPGRTDELVHREEKLAPAFGNLEREYEILGELGRGGMAVVYLARERELNRPVAIKVVRARYVEDEEAIARCAREARTVAQLQHANIVSIHAVRRLSDKSLALVMQYVPGRTLKRTVLEDGPFTFERAEQVLRDIAEALAYAHQRGIVHRDVKPENIFLDATSGRAMLSDFGIARSMEAEANLTLTGIAIGTPAYMSPEQVDGGDIDGRSDLYSLGLVGWEMLTGTRPWDGESLYKVLYRQKHDDLPPLDELRPDIPARLLLAIEGALQKDRRARWTTAGEFLTQLQATTAVPRRRRPRRKRPVGERRELAEEAVAAETMRYRRPVGAPYGTPARTRARRRSTRLLAVLALPVLLTGSALLLREFGHGALFLQPIASAELATGDPLRSDSIMPGMGSAPEPSGDSQMVPTGQAALDSQSAFDTQATLDTQILAAADSLGISPNDSTLLRPAESGRGAADSAGSGISDSAPPAFRDSATLLADAAGALAGPDNVASRDSANAVAVEPAAADSLVDTASSSRGLADRGTSAEPGIGSRSEPPAPRAADTTQPVESRSVAQPSRGRESDSEAASQAAERAGTKTTRSSPEMEPARRAPNLLLTGAGPSRSRTAVAAGGMHTCVLEESGRGYCWGGNDRGQIGNGGTSRQAAPVRIAGDLRFEMISPGVSHTCGVSDGGGAYCWGSNDRGQLGDGTTTAHASPVPVTGGYTFRDLRTGMSHTCGLTPGGEAYCWGANAYGQLGDGSAIGARAPTPVAGRVRFTMLALGWNHTCALTGQGRAYCWGQNASGQLGDGTQNGRTTPTWVRGELRFVTIAAGSAHSCGITEDGDAYCWGRNSYGQLGDGSTTDATRPIRVRGGERFVAIAVGSVHTCALTRGGEARCWGRNSYGQLGDGTTTDRAAAVQVQGNHRFRDIHASGAHTCGTTSAGKSWCWGYNVAGQVGDKTRMHRATPVRVGRPSG